MAAPGETPPIPRLSLTGDEAAAALGLSPSSFKRHVRPHLRAVRRGSIRLYPIGEIERWLDHEATVAGSRD